MARFLLALYLLSSALAAFDQKPLTKLEIGLRLLLLMMKLEVLWIGAAGATGALLVRAQVARRAIV